MEDMNVHEREPFDNCPACGEYWLEVRAMKMCGNKCEHKECPMFTEQQITERHGESMLDAAIRIADGTTGPLTEDIERILDENSAWIARPSRRVAEGIALAIGATVQRLHYEFLASERAAGWQHGDPRCDQCDNGIMPDWEWCAYCGSNLRHAGHS
jgi:hypothetical protein